MMNKNNRTEQQNREPRMARLRALLLSALRQEDPAPRSEAQWQGVENLLFDRLERETAHAGRPAATLPLRTFALPAFSSLGVLVAAVALFFMIHPTTQPLTESALLLSNDNTVVTQTDRTQGGPLLRAGTSLRTGTGGVLAARIDSHSGMLLSQNSEVIVRRADTRGVELFLVKGSVHCTVSRRAASQSFLVRTAQAQCTVVGTIFSVAATADATKLSVHEGHVQFSDVSKTGRNCMVSTGTYALQTADSISTPSSITVAEAPVGELSLLSMATAAPSGDSGWVSIGSDAPQCAIFIDNKPAGTTPLIARLAQGHHAITLRGNAVDTAFSCAVAVNRLAVVTVLKNASPALTKSSTERQVPRRNDAWTLPPSPARIEALVRMTTGEYRAAITILDSLRTCIGVPFTERLAAATDLSTCWKGLGDFSIKEARLTEEMEQGSVDRRESALWERAMLRENCLGDHAGAAGDLARYLRDYPRGAWASDASMRLVEAYCLNGEPRRALQLIRQIPRTGQSASRLQDLLYQSASITGTLLHDPRSARQLYTQLLDSHPEPALASVALFERAELALKLGDTVQARRDWSACRALDNTTAAADLSTLRLKDD